MRCHPTAGLLAAFVVVVSPQPCVAQDGAQAARSPAGVSRPALDGRPKIILIHGRAQEYRVGAQLRAEWLGAFRDGLRKLHMDSAVGDGDVEMINYQDAFEPGLPTPDGCDPTEFKPERYTEAQGGSGLVTKIFSARYRSAVLPVRNGLARTLRSPRLVTGALNDVETYFERNGGVACVVNRRLLDGLTAARDSQRPVVLAAHSLGSLVSYRVLAESAMRGPAIRVERFVTFGGQLPYRRLITYFMTDSSQAAFPPGVGRWVNIIGLGDLAAFPARDQDDFRTEPGQARPFPTARATRHGPCSRPVRDVIP